MFLDCVEIMCSVKSVAQPDGKAKNVGAGSINLVTGKENFNEEVKLTEADKAE